MADGHAGAAPQVDVVIVGAGFAGLYMTHRVEGLGLSVQVFEAGSGVGGTWYWNRYPGARCDVESMEYSYQFSEELQQEWEWTERYSGQPEILRYANHVADRFGLRDLIQFDTRVTAATFDELADRWTVVTDDGAHTTAQFVIMATGCLSSANIPAFPGIDSFTGPTYHTGHWPHEGVDVTGLKVGIIGTGSSAVQAIPVIAQQARELVVFQRTAQYSIPARNRPLEPAEVADIKVDYAGFRDANNRMPGGFGSRLPRNTVSALSVAEDERRAAFDARWDEGGVGFLGTFGDLAVDKAANDTAAEYVRERIRKVVKDPKVADLLSPKQVIGCKRLCIDSGYFDTFNRPNVSLVDVSAAPIEITPEGLRTGDPGHGAVEHDFDCIVFATGFDAMTGTLLRMDIRGRDGLTLAEKWSAGPRTYLGLGVPGFPNLFTISGPGSPSVLTNMIVSIEQHVNWITDCVRHLRANDIATIEATVEAEDDWVDHVNAVANQTLYPTCNSWYLGANVPGKTRVFMPLLGFPPYVATCEKVAANGYEGFALSH